MLQCPGAQSRAAAIRGAWSRQGSQHHGLARPDPQHDVRMAPGGGLIECRQADERRLWNRYQPGARPQTDGWPPRCWSRISRSPLAIITDDTDLPPINI